MSRSRSRLVLCCAAHVWRDTVVCQGTRLSGSPIIDCATGHLVAIHIEAITHDPMAAAPPSLHPSDISRKSLFAVFQYLHHAAVAPRLQPLLPPHTWTVTPSEPMRRTYRSRAPRTQGDKRSARREKMLPFTTNALYD